MRFSTNGADLHPVTGAVWASYRTGMAGGAELLDAAGLRWIVSPAKQPGPVWKDLSQGGPIIQGPSVAVLDGHAWLSSPTGIACLQATTGTFLGGAPLPDTDNGNPLWQPLAQTATAVYPTRPVAANGHPPSPPPRQDAPDSRAPELAGRPPAGPDCPELRP